MRKNDRRVKRLEADFAGRAKQSEKDRESLIESEGWLYRFVDIYRLTADCGEGRNKEYLSGSVSLAELARRAGVEPCGKDDGSEWLLSDSEYREDLLEEEECEAKGWQLFLVDADDIGSRQAWYERIGGKFRFVSEWGCFRDMTPEQIKEFDRRRKRPRTEFSEFF